VRTSTGLALVLASTVALTACAAHQPEALGNRFVKPGTPAVDFGGPPIGKHLAAADQTTTQALRRASAPPRAATKMSGAAIENVDPQLAASLLLDVMVPSSENDVRVAEEYRRLGILDAAYDRLARAIAKQPDLASAHELMARIWRDWGMPARGIGAAHRALYYAPRSPSAHNTLATLFEHMGRLDDARREYTRAAALDPTAGWIWNNLCHVALLSGRLDEAQANCESALTRQPDLTAAHNNLALALAAKGDIAGAEREFLAAGDPAAAAYNMGIVALAGQQYASAAKWFEQAILARPAFEAAKARAHEARVRALTRGQ
jgi:tetratricopeptide (TPR) repeat protein